MSFNSKGRIAYMREWHRANREHVGAYMRQWRKTNRERISAYQKRWWDEVREAVYPPHEYAKKSHCSECFLTYGRESKRQWLWQRDPWRNALAARGPYGRKIVEG